MRRGATKAGNVLKRKLTNVGLLIGQQRQKQKWGAILPVCSMRDTNFRVHFSETPLSTCVSSYSRWEGDILGLRVLLTN